MRLEVILDSCNMAYTKEIVSDLNAIAAKYGLKEPVIYPGYTQAEFELIIGRKEADSLDIYSSSRLTMKRWLKSLTRWIDKV